jgi:hypothetical protein
LLDVVYLIRSIAHFAIRRNNIVFNGVSLRLEHALLLAQDEADH